MNDNFVIGEIMVGIKSAYSVVNKVWIAADFPEISGITKIEDLTYADTQPTIKRFSQKDNFHQILKISISGNTKNSVIHGIANLEQNEKVLFAEPNSILKLEQPTPQLQSDSGMTRGGLAIDNDNRYRKYTNDPYLLEQDGVYLHNVDKVWNAFTKGASNIVVGVVDSGIALHEDIEANLVSPGYNAVTQTNDYNHTHLDSHGTSVASIIAAVDNNNKGMSGIAPNVKVKSYMIATGLDADGDVESDTGVMTQAILKADADNIDILNISYRIGNTNSLVNAVNMFDGLIVWCASNDGEEITSTNRYSRCYLLPNVIVVGGVDKSGQYYSGSNYSDTYVHLMALCNKTTQCKLNNTYETNASNTRTWGTSISAPFVAGVAALLLSYDNTLTTAQLKQYILEGVRTTSSLEEYCITGGYLDAYGAFLALENDSATSIKLAIPPHFETLGGIKYFAAKYEIDFTYEKNYAKLTEVELCEDLYEDLYNSSEPSYTLDISSYDDSAGKTHVTVVLQLSSNISQNGEPFVEFHFITHGNKSTAMAKISVSSQRIYNIIGDEMTPTSYVYKKLLAGDADGDGAVTTSDSELILAYAVGNASLVGNRLLAADVAGDMNVNAVDALWIMNYCNGNIKSFY